MCVMCVYVYVCEKEREIDKIEAKQNVYIIVSGNTETQRDT